MASPAAILSVLVQANSTQATTTLTKFDKQLAAVNQVARKGIDAKLGGTLNPKAFDAYQSAMERASRRAKDRAAFKAELGANFNNTAFNAYERQVDKVSKATVLAAEHNKKLEGSFREVAKRALEAGGAFAAFEWAKSAIESTTELSHATERLSAITGMDSKAASKWIEIAKVRGISAQQVGTAFVTLSKQVRTAQDGTVKQSAAVVAATVKQKQQLAVLKATGASQKTLWALQKAQTVVLTSLKGKGDKASATFRELGVSQALLKRGDTAAILAAAADGLAKIENPARKAALSQQLFGRGAQALIPILAEGSKGIDDALAAAQRYGAYLPQNVKQLEAARQAQFNLNLAADGLKIAFTQAVLPSLVQGAGKLLDFIGQMRSGKGAGGDFAKAISSSFKIVKTIVKSVVDLVGGIGPALEIAAGAFVASKLFKFAGTFTEVAKMLRSGPGKLAAVLGGGKAASHGAVSSSVATMEVGTLIAKSMVSGPGGGGIPSGIGAAEEVKKEATKPSKISRTLGTFGKIAKSLPGIATAFAVSEAVGVHPVTLAKHFGQTATGNASQTFHALTHGGVGSMPFENFPAVKHLSGPLPAPAPIPAFALRNGAFGGMPAPGALTGVTLDLARVKSLMQDVQNITPKTFGLLAQAAKQANDIPFAFGDHVSAQLLKAHGATAPVVADMLTMLHKLPVGAQTEAANTAIGIAAQLVAKGALPKDAADKLRAAITGSFVRMRTDSVAQASQLATDAAKPLGGLLGTVQHTADLLRAVFTANVPKAAPASAAAHAPSRHATGGVVTAPGYFAGEEAPQHKEIILASNPAYRQRNVKLWQQAGKMLGVAGFATGGSAGALQAQIAQDKTELAATPSYATALRASLKVQISGLAAQLKAASKSQRAATKAQNAAERAAKVAAAKLNAQIAKQAGYKAGTEIPSQAITAQIQGAQLSNALQAAQNSNNVGAQQKALNAQLKLEKHLLGVDMAQLAKVTKVLAGPLSKANRTTALQGKLSLLQEIGNLQGNIGSSMSSLQGLTGAGAAGSGTLDLALGNIALPSAYAVRRGEKIAAHGEAVTQVTNHITVTDFRAANAVAPVLERYMNGTGKAQQRAMGVR